MSKYIVNPRTFDPKFTHYMADGSGRDAFVVYNNGGMSQPRVWYAQESTSFFKRQPKTIMSPSPRKDSPPFEYRSDGSGRDSYIVVNSGGLKNKAGYQTGESFFKNSLRQNEIKPFNTLKTGYIDKSDITNYLNWVTPKQRSQMSEAARKQRSLISRLSPIRGSQTDETSKLNTSQMNTSLNNDQIKQMRISHRKCNSLNISQDFGTSYTQTPKPIQGIQLKDLKESAKKDKDNGSSYRRIKKIQLQPQGLDEMQIQKQRLMEMSLQKLNGLKKEDLLKNIKQSIIKDQ